MELQALTLPESRNFRPFIKTFQIFKQLTPNLLHINSYEFSINKRICVISMISNDFSLIFLLENS